MNQSPISNPLDDEKAYTRSFRLGLLGFILFVCLCFSILSLRRYQSQMVSLYEQYFPTPSLTSTPLPTSTSTRTPTLTATFTPTLNLTATESALRATSTALVFQSTATSAAKEWTEVFTETFDNNNHNWNVSSSDTEHAKMTFSIKDGKYLWNAVSHRDFIDWVNLPTKTLGDFALSLEVKLSDYTDTTDYGIVFRNDDLGNFYYFGISPSGAYSLYKYYGEWSVLIDNIPTPLIKIGEPNKLTIIAEGDHFILFINDQFVADAHDDQIPRGWIGMAIELFQPDQQVTVEFDNLVLRTP